jgi:hypothetical protein
MNLRKFFVGRTVGFIIVLIVAAIVAGFWGRGTDKKPEAINDYKDAEYVIEGMPVKLSGGKAETEAAPGSASKIVTKYFGNSVATDLDGDSRDDVVFLITQNSGGSGTFYYAVAARNTPNGYVGSEAFLLGDRIAPQSSEVGEGRSVIVNYAVRAEGEPFTTQPSIGKSVQLILDTGTMKLREV